MKNYYCFKLVNILIKYLRPHEKITFKKCITYIINRWAFKTMVTGNVFEKFSNLLKLIAYNALIF